MTKKVVTDLDVAGKKVLVRADFNVPRKMEQSLTITVLFKLFLQSTT